MRQFTDSERIARDVAKSSSDVPYLTDDLEHYIFDTGFAAALNHSDKQIATLEAERDSLRVRIRDVAWAALKYENATYLVKTYKSNGRYKRQLKIIHNILKAAQVEFGPEQ